MTLTVINMEAIKTFLFFFIAGFCEIGGGYLVWLHIREGKSIWLAIAGIFILFLYAVAATLQPQNFGRVYAAYGGIFIIMSLFWGWKVDGHKPDEYDFFGALIVLIGVCVMFLIPRK